MRLDAKVATEPPTARIQPARPRSAIGWEVARLLRDHGRTLANGGVVTVQNLPMAQRQTLRSTLDNQVRRLWPEMRLSTYQTDDDRLAIMLVKKQAKA